MFGDIFDYQSLVHSGQFTLILFFVEIPGTKSVHFQEWGLIDISLLTMEIIDVTLLISSQNDVELVAVLGEKKATNK